MGLRQAHHPQVEDWIDDDDDDDDGGGQHRLHNLTSMDERDYVQDDDDVFGEADY